jgi:hypothetical protein
MGEGSKPEMQIVIQGVGQKLFWNPTMQEDE